MTMRANLKTTKPVNEQLDALERLAEEKGLKLALEFLREARSVDKVWHPKACQCARCELTRGLP